MRNKKGFTLVELLVAISILGIVTVVSLPMIRVIQSSMSTSKANVYKQALEAAAKNYNDTHAIDTFGYQETGCVDIYYTDLLDAKLLEKFDFSNTGVVQDKVFVRVTRNGDDYKYEAFIPTAEEIASLDFSFCNGTITDNGPDIKFEEHQDLTPRKTNTTTIKIRDTFGISSNAVIEYQWVYADDHSHKIGSPVKKEFKNDVIQTLSLSVNTPSNLTGKFALMVKPISLIDEIGLSTTDTFYSGPFLLDNTKPDIVVKTYKYNNSVVDYNNVLSNKKNSETKITNWSQYGYYFDFSASSDANGIKKEIWEWNSAGSINLNKGLSESRKSIDNGISNKTFTGRGARYGKITMCDGAGNCNSADIIVNIATIYYIKYTGGESGSVPNTMCYYNYDCTLNNNGFSKYGYHFNKWKIGSNTYNAGAKVKNLSNTDNATVTATADWKGNTYYIAFNSNGGTGTVSNITCTYGSNCKLPNNNFSKSGYQFSGWKINSTVYNASQNVTNLATGGTLTAYAQWSANTYKIKYNGSGGSGSLSDTTCTYGSNCQLRNNSFSKNGYSFSGWKIGGTTYSPGQTVSNLSTGGDVVAYAQWNVNTYTISYNCNGGWNCPPNQIKAHGSNISLGSTPIRDGWEFVGWSTNSNAHSGYGARSNYTGNGNVTLYATWKRTITVNFYAGRCGWIGNQSLRCSYYNSETSCKITSPGIKNIPGTNKWGTYFSDWLKVRGWNTDMYANSSSYNIGSAKNFSSNANYYAIASLESQFTNRKWVIIADSGLNVRQVPDWPITGVMHKNTNCRNYNEGEWHYRGEVASTDPLWIRVTQYRNPPYVDKCGSGNGRGPDDNCDGWSSATYLSPV